MGSDCSQSGQRYMQGFCKRPSSPAKPVAPLLPFLMELFELLCGYLGLEGFSPALFCYFYFSKTFYFSPHHLCSSVAWRASVFLMKRWSFFFFKCFSPGLDDWHLLSFSVCLLPKIQRNFGIIFSPSLEAQCGPASPCPNFPSLSSFPKPFSTAAIIF